MLSMRRTCMGSAALHAAARQRNRNMCGINGNSVDKIVTTRSIPMCSELMQLFEDHHKNDCPGVKAMSASLSDYEFKNTKAFVQYGLSQCTNCSSHKHANVKLVAPLKSL